MTVDADACQDVSAKDLRWSRVSSLRVLRMDRPKLQHYVPRFYLARFADAQGRVWVFDKSTRRSFQTAATKIACVNHFYELPHLAEDGLDPNLMERQFSHLEGAAQEVLTTILEGLANGARFVFHPEAREALALFITLQTLRTVEARTILTDFMKFATAGDPNAPDFHSTEAGRRQVHAETLWRDSFVQPLVKRIVDSIWLFGLNDSHTPFITSDHPALVKSADNRGWVSDRTILGPITGGLLGKSDPADYFVFPLSPRCVFYAYDRTVYPKHAVFENAVSPVEFTPELAEHENWGQIGMSSRFVYSSSGDFSLAEKLLKDQPWLADPNRNRLEAHENPYEAEPDDT